MVEGIPPGEASERLSVFQSRFDGLFRKFVTYSTGEELFGLEITDYPQLHVVKKELGLLQKVKPKILFLSSNCSDAGGWSL